MYVEKYSSLVSDYALYVDTSHVLTFFFFSMTLPIHYLYLLYVWFTMHFRCEINNNNNNNNRHVMAGSATIDVRATAPVRYSKHV
jgi:hypothetical protein